MKYFSVSYIQEKKDIPKPGFSAKLRQSLNNSMLTKLIIGLAFAAVMWTTGEKSIAFFSAIIFIFLPLVCSTVFNSSYIDSSFKSKLFKRNVTVDFYADHLVYSLGQNEQFKGIYERHLAFDKVVNIFDFPDVFNFSFKDEGITIPKRAMTNEQIQMVYNLIENLFKNKYIKM